MFEPEAVAGYAVTAVLTIINLLVTYFVLKRFLFKPILKVLKKRRTEVETELTKAEETLTDAEAKLAAANTRLDNSNREAAEIVTNARSQAEMQGDSIITGAKQEAAGMLTRADSEVARLRVTMLNEVRDEVADLSVAIASKVIGHALDDKRQKELVNKLLDEEMQTTLAKANGSQSEVNQHA